MTSDEHSIGHRRSDEGFDGQAERIARELHAYFRRADARQWVPNPPAWKRAPKRSWFSVGRLARVGIVLAIAALFVPLTVAANNILNLGKPTSSVPMAPEGPLANFRHAGPVLHRGKKPVLLFLGTMIDSNSAAERWPLVKALEQFGSFSGIEGGQDRSCGLEGLQNQLSCGPAGPVKGYPTGAPTYNLEHAAYHSRYLVLTSLDLIDLNLQLTKSLTPTERNLFNGYVKNTVDLNQSRSFTNLVLNTALQPLAMESRRTFPLVLIGGYLETGNGAAMPGDFLGTNGAALPFDTVQETLAAGKPMGSVPKTNGGTLPGKVSPTLIQHVNAEANVITALICHADGGKPIHVCSRPVITSIAHHIR